MLKFFKEFQIGGKLEYGFQLIATCQVCSVVTKHKNQKGEEVEKEETVHVHGSTAATSNFLRYLKRHHLEALTNFEKDPGSTHGQQKTLDFPVLEKSSLKSKAQELDEAITELFVFETLPLLLLRRPAIKKVFKVLNSFDYVYVYS